MLLPVPIPDVQACAVCVFCVCVAVQLREQASSLQAYQLVFTFAALQKAGAPLSSAVIDKVCCAV